MSAESLRILRFRASVDTAVAVSATQCARARVARRREATRGRATGTRDVNENDIRVRRVFWSAESSGTSAARVVVTRSHQSYTVLPFACDYCFDDVSSFVHSWSLHPNRLQATRARSPQGEARESVAHRSQASSRRACCTVCRRGFGRGPSHDEARAHDRSFRPPRPDSVTQNEHFVGFTRMSSRYQKAFTIPDGFPQILKAFTREVRPRAAKRAMPVRHPRRASPEPRPEIIRPRREFLGTSRLRLRSPNLKRL